MYFSRAGKRTVSTAELESRLSLPRPFLRRILQRLEKYGVLKSARGAGGGFLLRSRVEKINLLELVEIFQGPMDVLNCTFRNRTCTRREGCRLRQKIKEIEQHLSKSLARVTVRSLMAS
jgi:Rrf2 family protein